MAHSQGFEQLHPAIQRWVWSQGWQSLRDIQEAAIPPILARQSDVIISASTAAGKTEAALLPALTAAKAADASGISILYISPLKALINDQLRRLETLADALNMSATPWHGDIPQSKKDALRKKPDGVLLITPESLESMLMNHAGWCRQAFDCLLYVVVDEFHAFLGSERGRQLVSLLHRIEFLIDRKVPRIALSATLGDMPTVADMLRPGGGLRCDILESTALRSDLKLQLRGYVETESENNNDLALDRVVSDLFRTLRGSTNLVFANSRNRTELIAAKLSDLCEKSQVPNEFFPHHGSLSKDLRQSVEQRLQKGTLPTTTVCTMTLELGIDIGSVDSVAQVTAPHSVASLRQRLGRSGRRGDAAVLRAYIIEDAVTDRSHPSDRLRMELFQTIATINLLLGKWYEPPSKSRFHFSTLVQQVLSVIGQYGGVQAKQLWTLLCGTGPFSNVDPELFGKFLRDLGQKDLITQTGSGELVLGERGEKVVGHYSFFTAFNSPEEFTLQTRGKVLGSLPVDKPLLPDEHLIFGGRRWRVKDIDVLSKVIDLEPAKGGKPPKFGGEGIDVHGAIREEMRRVYVAGAQPVYLDRTARELFDEGVEWFRELGLAGRQLVPTESGVLIFPWSGDKVVNTLTLLLRLDGLTANAFGGVVEVHNVSKAEMRKTLRRVATQTPPSEDELAALIPVTAIEKHDHWLSRELQDTDYAERAFDIPGALETIRSFTNTNREP